MLFLLMLSVTSLKGEEVFYILCSGWGGGERKSWKYFGEFLCTNVGESVFSHKHRFLAAAATGFTGSSNKKYQVEKTRMAFYLPHHVCVITSATSTKNR